MTKKKQKSDIVWLKKAWPYVLATVLTMSLVIIGSLNKHEAGAMLDMGAFAKNNYNVSVDQLSELRTVADVSYALNLASADDVAGNYVIISSMYSAGQSLDGKIEKTIITDIAISRGVLQYTTAEGETVETVAKKYGLSADQVRWSNGLKTTSVPTGTLLYLPSRSGIVYTVKANDTLEGIAQKYGSSVSEITILNDLETSGIVEGMRILIAGGTLPEKERPEYVAPVVSYNYSYSFSGYSSQRQNMVTLGYFYGLGGPYTGGQCTQWAWYRWQQNGWTVPSSWGNAKTWAANARNMGYTVSNWPVAGAIFHTASGWYGHVGYVESVNSDGTIDISEMNYGIPYRAIRSTVPAEAIGRFSYIYPR